MRVLIASLLMLIAWPVVAHQPVVVAEPTGPIEITDPNISFAYYGELSGAPQEFILQSEEPFTLYVSVIEPDIAGASRDHGAVVTRHDGETEVAVATLDPAGADWEPYFEPFGGDTYLNGPEFRIEEAPAGTYHIEVSSPNNEGKYVLVTGTVEDFSGTSYWATLQEIYKVKLFFNKSPLAIVQTPFVYGPLALALLMVALGWYLWRRRAKHRLTK